jgi:hypothetical protein
MAPQRRREARPLVDLVIAPDTGGAIVKLRGEHDLTTKPRVVTALAAARSPNTSRRPPELPAAHT